MFPFKYVKVIECFTDNMKLAWLSVMPIPRRTDTLHLNACVDNNNGYKKHVAVLTQSAQLRKVNTHYEQGAVSLGILTRDRMTSCVNPIRSVTVLMMYS